MNTKLPKYIVIYSNDTFKLANDRETVDKLVLEDDLQMIVTVYEVAGGFTVHKKSTTKWVPLANRSS